MELSVWEKWKAVLTSERTIAFLVGVVAVVADRLGLNLSSDQLYALVGLIVTFIAGASYRKPGTVPIDTLPESVVQQASATMRAQRMRDIDRGA